MGFLEKVTPVVLTHDEQPNIGRCLERLRWAKQVVVVDSESSDGTAHEVSHFDNARLVRRHFDAHANQWNFGLAEVATDWVLALDADYMLTSELVAEIDRLPIDTGASGFSASFRYACLGHELRSTIYPAKVVLFRRSRGTYRQDGHTQRLSLDGDALPLKGQIVHDDRKSFDRWLASQWRYARLEAGKMVSSDSSTSALAGVRRLGILSPLVVAGYLYIVRGLFLDGLPGARYVLERTVAECLILIALGEARFGRSAGGSVNSQEREP